MTVKIAIKLDDIHREFAEKMMADGLYPSVSSVVQAGIEKMMSDSEDVPADALAGMTDEIRRRLELPRDQWISMDTDNVFDRIRARLAERK